MITTKDRLTYIAVAGCFLGLAVALPSVLGEVNTISRTGMTSAQYAAEAERWRDNNQTTCVERGGAVEVLQHGLTGGKLRYLCRTTSGVVHEISGATAADYEEYDRARAASN